MPRGNPKENPRSFRLSAKALAALARLQDRRGGQSATSVMETLIIAADEADQRLSLEERVARLEQQIGGAE